MNRANDATINHSNDGNQLGGMLTVWLMDHDDPCQIHRDVDDPFDPGPGESQDDLH